MKIRIENQEVRFRLSEEEKALLKSGGMISTHLIYGEGILNSQSFSLLVSNQVDKITLDSTNGIFEILFPKNYADAWDHEKVGFEGMISLVGCDDLKIVIEKDLKRMRK